MPVQKSPQIFVIGGDGPIAPHGVGTISLRRPWLRRLLTGTISHEHICFLFSVSLITFQFFAVCFRSGFQSAFKYTTSYCTVSPFLDIKNISIACLPCQVRFCKLRRFHNITQNEPAFMMLYYNFKDFKHINRALTRIGLNYNEQ